MQRPPVPRIIGEYSKNETVEPQILQESIIQEFQSQESSLSQRFEAKDLDSFREDVVVKGGEVSHLRRVEVEEDLFQPTSRSTTPLDGRGSLNSFPHSQQSTGPIYPVVEQPKRVLHLLLGRLAHLPFQTINFFRRPAFTYRVPQRLTKSRQLRPEVAFNREEEIKLVQRVFLLSGKNAPRAVVFAGVEHGDGCSWICARASETLASQVTGTVCVVDANLRSPSLHQYFGLNNNRGLTEAVLHSSPLQKYAQQLPAGNLWALTSGSLPSDPQAFLTSENLRSRIIELRGAFDFVLIDTPPVGPYADASVVSQMADGVVLVVAANFTRREAALRAKEIVEAVNSRVLAAVLNKRTLPIPEGIYRKL